MKRWIRLVPLLSLPVALGAFADTVRTKERVYVVKYADNAIERYSVKWNLNVNTTLKEDGGANVPYQGAERNQRCAWSITPSIDRSVSLVTRLGQAMPLPNQSRPLKDDAAGVVSGEARDSCKGADSRRKADFERANRAALERFETLTNADFDGLKKDAQAASGVASVTE